MAEKEKKEELPSKDEYRNIYIGYDDSEIVNKIKEEFYNPDHPKEKFKVPKYKKNKIRTSKYN